MRSSHLKLRSRLTYSGKEVHSDEQAETGNEGEAGREARGTTQAGRAFAVRAQGGARRGRLEQPAFADPRVAGRMTALTPEPTREDRELARELTPRLLPASVCLSEGGWSQFWQELALFRAAARHAGEVAERERCARLAEKHECADYCGTEDIAAAIRSLAPDSEGKP
jgi:hypothetical protein